MRILAQTVAGISFGLAVYFALSGYEMAAGGWTFSGVVWLPVWADK